MKIGVIGTGTIASAVVRGIAGDGHDIAVSERGAARAADLARAFDNVSVHDNAGVVAASDVIFLGLMAEAAGEILAGLSFRAGQRVISFMAGASLEEVRAASHKTIPVGRYGTVEEFASVAAFLASAPASFVTGSMLRCDGGMIRSV